MMVGLPGCGKSTRARELMEDGNVMRCNRDDIRAMLFKRWKGSKEPVVSEIEKAAIVSAVSSGFDIIIDDTNLSPNTSRRWKNLSVELGVALVEESFQTTIEECIERDALRVGKAHVTRGVIENMALRYGLIPPVEPDRKVVIFDVDGTLVDCTHRQHWIKNKPKDHARFYAEAVNDPPITKNIQWVQECHSAGDYIIIVSGRPTDLNSDITVRQLQKYGVVYRHLFMRAAEDYRDDDIVKQEILDGILKWIPKEQIAFTVDDRPRVIRMWRANGLLCHDVGLGIDF